MPYIENLKMDARSNYLLKKFSIVIFLIAIFYVAEFAISILAAPDSLQVQYTPDDGYYYLTLARNYVHTNQWTFDSQNATSGFHILWANLLAIAYWIIRPSDSQFVHIGLLLNIVIILFALLFIGWEGMKQKKWFWGLIFGAVFISSRNFEINSISITEWCLVVLFSYLYFSRAHKDASTSRLLLFTAGLLGVLARSDFILLALVILAIRCVVFYFERNRTKLFTAVLGMGGAISGLLITGLIHYAYTGTFLQSSALIKALWTKLGLSYLQSMLLAPDILGLSELGILVGIIVFVSISIFRLYFVGKAIWIWDKKRLSELTPVMEAAAAFLLLLFSIFITVMFSPGIRAL